MANKHSHRTSSNAPKPLKGLAYTPDNSHDILSSHTTIPSLHQTQNTHHNTKAKKNHLQGKQIIGEGEELGKTRSPYMDLRNSYLRGTFQIDFRSPNLQGSMEEDVSIHTYRHIAMKCSNSVMMRDSLSIYFHKA